MSQNKTSRPAKARKEYHSVAEMVNDLSDDKAFAGRVARKITERNLISHLMGLRAAAGLSQGDIAEKMRCTQSRISKLENGKDDDLRIGDFHAYADALGLEMMIVLEEKDRTLADEVKYHALEIKRRLKRMANLACKDPVIAQGVKGFFREAALNLGRIIEEAAKTVEAASQYQMLPSVRRETSSAIRVESPGRRTHEQCEEADREQDLEPTLVN